MLEGSSGGVEESFDRVHGTHDVNMQRTTSFMILPSQEMLYSHGVRHISKGLPRAGMPLSLAMLRVQGGSFF